jgi:hypothetical protein
MPSRLARDDEVDAWRNDGWIVLDGLIGTDEIDDAAADLVNVFPTPDEYHADPEGVTRRWLGTPPEPRGEYVWPAEGPGFRPEQHRWKGEFPFPSNALNRLTVHDSIVDFMRRALGTDELRCYQAQLTAKYAGFANYEQPMHTDRNHSWLPALTEAPWLHVETFLYMSDVFEENSAPTHLVPLGDSAGRDTTVPLVFPKQDPELYAAERPAVGPRGSLLVYRTDVFHRAVNMTASGGARFLLNVSYKNAAHEWIGFHTMQSRATSPHWVAFAESCTPAQLELYGFPPPGHEIWDDALLEATQHRYPKMDLEPWRAALAGRA